VKYIVERANPGSKGKSWKIARVARKPNLVTKAGPEGVELQLFALVEREVPSENKLAALKGQSTVSEQEAKVRTHLQKKRSLPSKISIPAVNYGCHF
jgi:hypothetical protein